VRDVAQGFARGQRRRGLVHEDRGAAESGHAGFKGQARAQRRLLEEHRHLLAAESGAKVRRPRLHQAGEFENGRDLGRFEVGDRDQVAVLQRLDIEADNGPGGNRPPRDSRSAH
jgi:hypothetical protein